MPFQSLTGAVTVGRISAFPAQQPCHGHPVSGDGLFVEVGRQDGGLLFLLVDVMGHGHAANQTVALLEHQMLPNPFFADLLPGRLLTRLNERLQTEFTVTGRFVTALALLADEQRGILTGANASQPQPYARQFGAGWHPWQLPNGLPLGILVPTGAYQEAATTLAVGQHLLAFTDGVTEAGATLGNQFQHGHLQRLLTSLPPGLPADQVVAQLLQALQSHVPTGWPEDDTTILCLQRN
jgi:serine phosphatase RsbU (regulator of sigma subunit)